MVLDAKYKKVTHVGDQPDTPALVVEKSILTANINKMATYATAHDVNLRPHVKAHKCVEIAGLQLRAGATGVSCATIAEAEMIVRFFDTSVLITSPVVTENKLRRLMDLRRNHPMAEVMVVCDNLQNLSDLLCVAAAMNEPLGVLIDLDVGQRRTGVSNGDDIVELATRVQREDRLALRGLQAYGGHIQHISGNEQRREAANAVHKTISQTVEMAVRKNIHFEIISGGGTGTHDFDAPSHVFTELQPGSYVFMDDEYRRVLSDDKNVSSFEISLRVQATVVSTNRAEWVIVDAGTKSFATDSGKPILESLSGEYYFSGDEHGKVAINGPRPGLGAQIRFITPHCDPTVNLYDVIHVFDGENHIDTWRIGARGSW